MNDRLLLRVIRVIGQIMEIFRRRSIPRKLKRLSGKSPALHEIIDVGIEGKCGAILVIGCDMFCICQNVYFQTQGLERKRFAGVTRVCAETCQLYAGEKIRGVAYRPFSNSEVASLKKEIVRP